MDKKQQNYRLSPTAIKHLDFLAKANVRSLGEQVEYLIEQEYGREMQKRARAAAGKRTG